MKLLEKEFIGKGEVGGFIFKMENSNDKSYLFKVIDQNGHTHYEVFEHKVNTRYNTVTYPSSKAFGTWAFSFLNPQKAYDKFLLMSSEG